MRQLVRLLSSVVALSAACEAGVAPPGDSDGPTTSTSTTGGGGTGGAPVTGGAATTGGSTSSFEVGGQGSGGAPACTGVSAEAALEALPVDIIWMVDNSNSMEPAIAEVKTGMNDFAALIAASSLDYKVILLSKRGTAPLEICIPQPLAGDDACGNGPRFFQSSVDVLSTQPLEQFLGTLGQTNGYMFGQPRGGEPWAAELRPEATKTIVVVTDDNARLSATQFQTFAGGQNPFNSLTLPPGILDPSWNGLFDGFLFSGIYGWGDPNDPSVTCEFPNMSSPASSGPTYTTLVQLTGGVRAKICDGAPAWASFFDSVAQAVVQSSEVACVLAIPPPPEGEVLAVDKVNVELVSGDDVTLVPNVGDEAGCAGGDGWYYDDLAAPANVVLCPASCEQAQELAGPSQPGKVDVRFGCDTIVR
jgi:hypothetical protein